MESSLEVRAHGLADSEPKDHRSNNPSVVSHHEQHEAEVKPDRQGMECTFSHGHGDRSMVVLSSAFCTQGL